MSRTNAERADPIHRLAVALRAACLEVQVIHDPHHTRRWPEVTEMGALGWRHVATHLLALGVQPPPMTKE